MKISKSQLIEMGACASGLLRFIVQTGNTEEAVEASSLVGGVNTIYDLMWLAGKTLPKEKIVRFACDCALINIELIRPYTDKFDAIVAFLHNPVGHTAICADTHEAVDAAIDADAGDRVYEAARAVRAASRAAADGYAEKTASRAATAAEISPDKVNELLKDLFK